MPPAKIALAALLFLGASAAAQELDPIDPAAIVALKQAYHFDGEWERKNEIDRLADRVLVPPPVAKRAETDELQQKWVRLRGNRTLPNNICEEHHMHKVYYGDKWRCRK